MSSSRPRVTDTALKAVYTPPLAAFRRTKSELEKVAERKKKFREAEEQLEKHIFLIQKKNQSQP